MDRTPKSQQNEIILNDNSDSSETKVSKEYINKLIDDKVNTPKKSEFHRPLSIQRNF